MSEGRDRKLRQAAFVYLLVGILYESAVFALAHAGLLPSNRGPVWVWLLIGAAIVAAIFWGLWSKRSVWVARVVFVFQGLRLPALIGGAFFPEAGVAIPSSFYLTALVVIVISMWMMARAGWDL
jgi:hypothetical protein